MIIGKLELIGSSTPEGRDAVELLTGMYQAWAERQEFRVVVEASLERKEGVCRSILKLEKESAYMLGLTMLEWEHGIHRISRISPHDPERRRHTSFVQVLVRDANGGPYTTLDDEAIVRSYLKNPMPLVYDPSTNHSTNDVEGVLARGEIDQFLDARRKLFSIEDHIKTIEQRLVEIEEEKTTLEKQLAEKRKELAERKKNIG